jgi:hypothetical protein
MNVIDEIENYSKAIKVCRMFVQLHESLFCKEDPMTIKDIDADDPAVKEMYLLSKQVITESQQGPTNDIRKE